MKLWILTNQPPVSSDTAYLIGRVLSHCLQVFITPVTEGDQEIPEVPGLIDGIFNRSFNVNPLFLQSMDILATNLAVPFINPGAASMLACDKRSYSMTFSHLVPETWIIDDTDALSRLWQEIGMDLVLKSPFGKRGKEVFRFCGEEDWAAAENLFAKAPKMGVVAQRFCPGFLSGDKRVILHRRFGGGYEIAAWYKRVPKEGGWISNISAGGHVEQCELEDDEKNLSMEVAEIAGLDYIGIDIGRDQGRCLLIETNAYTGGHIDFDTIGHRNQSGDEFARMIKWLIREGRT